jgi:large subunit ribosomal protein L7/L12
VKALATLPSREVLLAQLLGLLQAPASQLLRTLNEPAARSRARRCLGKRQGGAPPSSPRTRNQYGSSRKERQAMEVTREQVKDYLKSMSLMDAATLVKELESELGVSAAAPVAIAAAGAAPVGALRRRREKEDFTVVLTAPATRRSRSSRWSRAHRARPQGGEGPRRRCAEARQGGRPEGGGRDIKKKLEEAGGTVELK